MLDISTVLEVIIIKILLTILFIIGIIYLQAVLSKKDAKWLGLILPIISILFSIFFVLNIAFFGDESIGQIIYTLLISFFVTNIPTAVFFAIFLKYHSKLKA